MFKRIWENIKWCIFNHPVRWIDDPTLRCDYCGGDTCFCVNYVCICNKCLRKVYDTILKGDQK